MARIRTIKPEFPQSESMGRVSREARLCFIQLWTIADDSGRLRGNSRMLASLLYPYDNDAPDLIDKWLTELVNEKCIIRYLSDDQNYIQICNWLSHQKIDKPSTSHIPPFDESSRIFANPLESSSEDLGMDLGREGNGSITPQAATPKPFEVTVPEKANPLFTEIRTAFEKVNGNFTNYGKEGKAIKLIIKMTKGDQNAIRVMIRTFFILRQRNDKYWSSMPFTPSRLAASGVWDGVKEEAKKTLAAADTSWIDAMVKEEVAV